MSTVAVSPDLQFGLRLRALRVARGWSLARAAQDGNVSKSALAGWEAGRRTPSGEVLAGLLGALGASPRDKSFFLAVADPRHARVALAHTDEGPPIGLGEVLRAMRLRRGLTQAELAGRLGSAQSTVARWERGDQDLGLLMQRALMRTLEASPDELAAIGSLDACRPRDDDYEERYARIVRAPHGLGEVLWLGLEADLWWSAAQSDRYGELLQRVVGHRADWYAQSMRPQEAMVLARRAVRGRYSAPDDVPQAVAYGIVYAALQTGGDVAPALRALDRWMLRLRTGKGSAMVQALRARLVARMDFDDGLEAMEASQRAAREDEDLLHFVLCQRARLLIDHGRPEAALVTLEQDTWIDAEINGRDTEYIDAIRLDKTTLRALALARMGENPPEAWMAAIRTRRATRQIPLYRERLNEIEGTLDRLKESPGSRSRTPAASSRPAGAGRR